MATGKVLYIEDNFENRILIKRVLEAEGYTVIEAENGLSGLEQAKTTHPDLVLMDINLPDIDGYEATSRMRKMDGLDQIPIVALTANVLEGDRQKALGAGCVGYIPKPIDVDDLPNQIAEYLKDSKKKEPDSQPAASAPDRPEQTMSQPASQP
nr:response regulator [Anaerolineae bacterium]